MDDKSICLNCLLPDCDDKHPDCPFREYGTKQKRYYRKMRDDPEFKKRRQAYNKKWMKGVGREKYNAAMRKWRKKNPEKLQAIQARAYKKKQESLRNV
jgi:hypothetical protein